ncbi:hypothetical protein [Streptomyces sp. C10-9-1]|uniref:hypothetical protein n=1 Tax=Streptomyces sp. C10-9-1 TaxID=1859285 RepID=UPI003F4A74DB
MHGPGNWPRRTRTGLLGASACLLPGAVGHVAAGGRLPGAVGLAGVFAVLALVCTALGGLRRHRFAATALFLGAVQSVLHLVFHAMTGGHGAPAAQPGAGGAHPGHGHHGMPSHGADAAPAGTSGHAADPGMTLAHTLAALCAAVCLIHGERVLGRLAGLLLRPLLRIPAAPAVPVPPGRPGPGPGPAAAAPHGVLHSRVHPRRGPPRATYA